MLTFFGHPPPCFLNSHIRSDSDPTESGNRAEMPRCLERFVARCAERKFRRSCLWGLASCIPDPKKSDSGQDPYL